MSNETGVPCGTGSRPAGRASKAVSPVPASIPNAYPYRKADAYQRGCISERKAICSFLVYCAARAAYRWTQTPWWNVKARLQAAWSMAALSTCVEQIERGDHLQDQSSWLIETCNGQAIYDGIASAIEARSGETVEHGSTEGESAVGEAETPNLSRETR